MWAHTDRRWVVVEQWFTVALVALFLHSVLDWQGVFGESNAWRPLQSVYMTGAMVLNGFGAVVGRRSPVQSLVLSAASIGLMVYSIWSH